MSEETTAPPEQVSAKWPAKTPEAVAPPLTTAALATAAANVVKTNSRHHLLEYLRLRRKAK